MSAIYNETTYNGKITECAVRYFEESRPLTPISSHLTDISFRYRGRNRLMRKNNGQGIPLLGPKMHSTSKLRTGHYDEKSDEQLELPSPYIDTAVERQYSKLLLPKPPSSGRTHKLTPPKPSSTGRSPRGAR